MDEGIHCYASIITLYFCMVGTLHLHAGHLQEAENTIKAMPCKRDVAAWMALLSARKIHDTVEMGEPVAKRILELEPKNTVG